MKYFNYGILGLPSHFPSGYSVIIAGQKTLDIVIPAKAGIQSG
jgi:hypothetical protein